MPSSRRARPRRPADLWRTWAPVRRKRRGALLVLMFVVLGGAGCGTGLPNPFDRGSSRDVLVRVESRNWADHNIFLLRGGARVRLGTVTSQTTQTFRLPEDMSAPGLSVRLVADPVGSAQTFTSREISLNGGETWVWTLMPQIEQSTLVPR